MRRMINLLMVFIIGVALVACGKQEKLKENSQTESVAVIKQEENNVETDIIEEKPEIEQPVNELPQHEYITTYHMYAKRGAVVTDYDSTTGSFTYIGKCEMCGETDGMVNNMGATYGGSISASFVCKNPNCSMKGKSQPVEIGCETSGEWVEK